MERRERLLGFFSEHPKATIAEAGAFLGVARSTVNRDVAVLRGAEKLVHEGPLKGGRWITL